MSSVERDPGVEFAGAQLASWRKKKGVTQRRLMDEKIISQAPLVHFENGRSWPRERTRAKLEERLGLPAGQIADWRYGNAGPATADAMPLRTDVMVAALDIAVQAVQADVLAIPPAKEADYWPAVVKALRDLRKLDATVTAAARTAPVEAVLSQLRSVRRSYDGLLRAAAEERPEEQGPQLYVARTAAQMSVQEAAAAAGVPEPMVAAVESCQIEAPPQIVALLLRLRD